MTKKHKRRRKTGIVDGGMDLLNLIFSWSVKDILNKDLYKEKVKQIPEIFPSTVEYLNSFMDPLIEEIHADFYSALENVAQAPVCEVLVTPNQIWPREYVISTERTNYLNHQDEGYYRPRSGDVLLLTSSRLKNVKDLNKPREAFLMAFVAKNANQLGCCDYNILTSKAIHHHQIPQKPMRLTATYMINLTTNMRIWSVLNCNPQLLNLSLIKSVLHYDSSVEQNDCSIGLSEEEIITVSDLISSFSLDESQRSAILSSISMKNCSHEAGCSKVKLIWGPPGTGKTKTVASLLFALLKLKYRTLTCAPTNIAVVQVVKRLMDLVLRYPDKYGNCRLGDIVLLGDAGRMKTDEDDDIAKVFLSNRVQILSMSIKEWYSSLQSIRSLLNCPEKQYDEYNHAMGKSSGKSFYTGGT